MARFETSAGLEGITGIFNKQTRLTMRRKHWHYPDGTIFGCGPKEVYEQERRDYKRHPRSAAEEAQHQKWTDVCRETSRILKDVNHPRYAEMIARHSAQLRGNPDAVVGRRICMFGNFVRAVLMHEE